MKTFSFVLISAFFAILLAQDCNNPLLNTFNLTGLDAPETVDGLAFCDNLQNGQTCCSAETVQGFQERLESLTTSLQNLAGQRDSYLNELFANYSNQYQSAADDLTDYSDEIDRLQRDNETIGNETRAQYRAIGRIANALDRIDDHFRSSVREYQQRRVTCFNTLLQVQSSAWCLACDPNYANLGVQPDGSVNSSPEVCNAIQSNCALYVERAGYLNPLWQAQQSYDRLVNLTRYLRDYKNNNYVIADNVTLENDIFVPTNDTERTSALPENCTQESCQWQCENFFSPSLVLNESIAGNGGGILGGDDIDFPPVGSNMPPPVVENTTVVNETTTVVNETVTEVGETVTEVGEAVTEVANEVISGSESSGAGFGRLLQELQESLWAPNLDGTGLNFNVAEDPANIAALWNNNPVFDDSDTNNPTDTENTNTDNDDDFTDNDGIKTTETDNTDNDGFDTTNNTDNDGFDTTGYNDNTDTDNDGFDTTNNTDRDGIDTTGDDTNNDDTNDDDTNPTNPTNDDTDN